jgi:hypothetical protein
MAARRKADIETNHLMSRALCNFAEVWAAFGNRPERGRASSSRPPMELQ